MDLDHLERLRRARDLQSVKGYQAAEAVVACYSGTGFSSELRTTARADPRVQLVDLDLLCQE